jgi:hypothetical protein
MSFASSGVFRFSTLRSTIGGVTPILLGAYSADGLGIGIAGIPSRSGRFPISAFRGKTKTLTVNYGQVLSATPVTSGISGSIWQTSYGGTGYWTGIGSPSWVSESAPSNQAATKVYEKIYNSSSVADVPVRFYFQFDNSGTIYVNGTPLGSNSNWTATSNVTGTLKYGNNRIHVICNNADPPGSGGILLSCVRLSDNAVLFVSDSSWRMGDNVAYNSSLTTNRGNTTNSVTGQSTNFISSQTYTSVQNGWNGSGYFQINVGGRTIYSVGFTGLPSIPLLQLVIEVYSSGGTRYVALNQTTVTNLASWNNVFLNAGAVFTIGFVRFLCYRDSLSYANSGESLNISPSAIILYAA